MTLSQLRRSPGCADALLMIPPDSDKDDPEYGAPAPSLATWLSVMGASTAAVAALFGLLALTTPYQQSKHLERLEESARTVFDVERFAGTVYELMVAEVRSLASTEPQVREDLQRTLFRARQIVQDQLEETKPQSKTEQLALSRFELLNAMEGEYSSAQQLASTGQPLEASAALRKQLDLLAKARISQPNVDAQGGERMRLEFLANRVSLAADHPVLRPLGGGAMRSEGLTSLFEALAAQRSVRALRFDRWQRDRGGEQIESGLALHMHELDRVRTLRTGDQSDLAATFAGEHARIVAREGYASPTYAKFEARWISSFERASQESFAHFHQRAAALARSSQYFFSFLIAVTAGFMILTMLIPSLVKRRVIKPLEDLIERLRDPESSNIERLGSWMEFDEIGMTFSSLSKRTEETNRRSMALAFYDSVTGVPNRRFFLERLGSAIITAKTERRQIGLLLITLDDLSAEVDSLSQAIVEDILRQVAGRLHDVVRLSDLVTIGADATQMNTLSRMSDTEFSLLLTGVKDAQDCARVADRVLARLANPFEVENKTYAINTNVGLSIYPTDATASGELLRRAQVALRHARERGSNQYQFFSARLNDVAARRFHVRNRLSGALSRGDLSLQYQPVRDTRTGLVTCAEVLMRWSDEEMGPVSPSEFIPIAEQAGLMSSLGRWALEQACQQHRTWVEEGYEPIRLSVNVSPVQFAESDWPDVVRDTLERSGISADYLDLEITETALLKEGASTVETFERLVELGVGLVVDDFGTGYSSISYLHRYPVDRIKIDRSFVSTIDDDGNGAGICNAILAMADSLGLPVIAEGVETERQAELLIERGCCELQGFLISHAVSPDEFVRFLQPVKQDGEA